MKIKDKIVYSRDKNHYGEYEIQAKDGIQFAVIKRYVTVNSEKYHLTFKTAKNILLEALQQMNNEKCLYVVCRLQNIPSLYLFLDTFKIEKLRIFDSFKELSIVPFKNEIESMYDYSPDFNCANNLYKRPIIIYYPFKDNAPLPFNFMRLSSKEYNNRGFKVIEITKTKPTSGEYIITKEFNVGDEDKFDIYVSDNAIQSIRKEVK